MLKLYPDTFKSERTVEVPYIIEKISSFSSLDRVLDVGGVATSSEINAPIYEKIKQVGCSWKISDFRPCHFPGDFVLFDFGDEKFDKIIFLSSLEHFENCTEGDNKHRENYDRQGFKKALSLLDAGGEIYMTAPVGKPIFVPFHRSYNKERLDFLSEGSIVTECLIYKLDNEEWRLSDFSKIEDVLNPGPVNAVGLFKFIKK